MCIWSFTTLDFKKKDNLLIYHFKINPPHYKVIFEDDTWDLPKVSKFFLQHRFYVTVRVIFHVIIINLISCRVKEKQIWYVSILRDAMNRPVNRYNSSFTGSKQHVPSHSTLPASCNSETPWNAWVRIFLICQLGNFHTGNKDLPNF